MIRSLRVSTRLFEAASGSVAGKRASRIFKGVTLIKAGLGNKRDRNYYPAETLERAVREGKFDGMKAFIDHPTSLDDEIQPERSVRDIAGVYENPRYNASKKTVEADLRIFGAQGWLADTIDELIETGHAKQIGLSINGRGKTEPARRRLEEAGGEEIDVNEVKDFLELRSTDIVTEAGAGGGFAAALLESNRRRAQETTPMARSSAAAKALKLIKDGNVAEAEALLEAAVAPNGKPAVKTKTKPTAAKVEEAKDEDEDGEDQDALEEAADDIKAQADAEAETADDEPADDEDEDEEDEEDDEEDEDGDDASETTEANTQSSHGYTSARDKFRRAASTTREADTRRKIIGATGKTGTVNKPNTHFTKRDGAGAKRGKRVNTKSTMGFKKVKPGARFSPVTESNAQPNDRVGLLRENAALRKANSTLAEKNSRLAEALNTYRSTDVASRLLAESDVPVKLRPSLLKQMVGMSRQEMNEFINAEVERINVIAESVGGRIEGAGSSLREAAFMSGADGQDASSVLGRFVPLKR